ncbi:MULTISPECIES: DUF4259 domain-containing protein [Kitasatospora]|uniref:DUF4259 domain-containing protein n=1 Tax=Kitasatospora setae (strain ATCC 33774 / DSM 43861 / JCM 3304 / KCC A-0304 / NBRC 14216 / KM-6054) TaxID=452652 RepID=E4N8N0_KITSK|nr:MULTISPECIES: DUF4259 domain-containing protein [Kitasatospora]BAJ27561.1 hypothetical protein KSE_17370 [Kitasatospora setae KM-6054]
MGAWDTGHFDNDTAADFSGTLDDTAPEERAALLRETLAEAAAVAADDYLDSDVACTALAAAALVASHCPGGTPVTTAYGPQQPLPPLADLRPLAFAAVERVLAEESELAELWDETELSADWRAAVTALRTTLLPV